MRYRDIAKKILLDRGSYPVTPDLGEKYGEGKPFTEKQTRKVKEATDDIMASLSKKWKIAD